MILNRSKATFLGTVQATWKGLASGAKPDSLCRSERTHLRQAKGFFHSPMTGTKIALFSVKVFQGKDMWRHDYVFDSQNRLLNEKSVIPEIGNYEYFPVDITYEYEGALLKKIVKKSAGYTNYGTLALGLVTTYRYADNRRIGATIINYYNAGAGGYVYYPTDSTRRRFIYSNNQSIIEQDSNWYVPCFPNVPCINKFVNVDSTIRYFDARGNLLSIGTTLNSPLYPKGKATFQYEYKGPDGLLSRIVNADAGLVYHFRYLGK